MKGNQQDDAKRFYSPEDLADRWNTTYRNLHRQAVDGRIRSVKLGGLRRVPRDEVERIEEHGF